MNRTAAIVIGLLLLAGAIATWWWQQEPATEMPLEPPAGLPAEPEPEPAPPAETGPKFPIEDVAPEQPVEPPPPPAEVDDSLEAALIDLLGADAVSRFLRITAIPQRTVATVDNLTRSHATPKAWPVQPTPGRFSVDGEGDSQRIADANSRRYDAFVKMATSVDTARAVALYKKHYPVFQEAYEQQGFPDAHFNDRLVAAIDSLLATPEPQTPIRVYLTELPEGKERVQPWVHYRYVDPQLEALPAGQKMMLRMGAENRKALKEKLREVRRHLVGAGKP